MKLTFLGTASCFPTPSRGVSCTALHLDSGNVWIFDCGEGSQIQIQKSNVKAGKVNKIFITHLHGDHLFGLPGFLCTLGNGLDPEKAKSVTVTIYGPVGLRRFVTTSLGLSRSPLAYQLSIVELVPREDMYPDDWDQWDVPQEDNYRMPCEASYKKVNCSEGAWHLFSEAGISVSAAALVHRIPSFGFIITEDTSPGQLDSGKLLAEGVKPGPIYGKLKAGQVVKLDDGKVLNPENFVGPHIPGRQIGIMGDTSDSSEIIPLCNSLDVLVHEATMENELMEKAVTYGHSTPTMASRLAIKAGAKKLILFHLSPRYKPIEKEDEDNVTAKIILDEAVNCMTKESAQIEVAVAQDFMEVEIPRKIIRNILKS